MWTPSNPAERKFISYEGLLPDRIYRYRSLSPATMQRTIEFEILGEAIYLAALKDLNDPDECRFLMKFIGTDQDILDYWRRSIRSTYPTITEASLEDEALSRLQAVIASHYTAPEHVVNHTRHVLEHVLRVACFTTHPVNYLMWANYAKHSDPMGKTTDHGGICIEYRCDEAWRQETLHPVEYSDVIPEINAIEQDERKFASVLYMKSREWRGEEEWRLSYVLQASQPFEGDFARNAKIKLEGAVASVIFGLKTPQAVIDEIRTKVSTARPDISYKRVVRNPLTFARELAVLP